MPADKKDERNSQCEQPSFPGRLRSRRVIDSLFKEGRRIHGKQVSLIFMASRGSEAGVAVFVPTKLGTAVRRNHARRVIREALRRQPHPALCGKNTIVLCKKPVSEDFLIRAKEELPGLLDRLAREK